MIMDNLHPMRIRAQQQTYSLWFSVKMHSYAEFKKESFVYRQKTTLISLCQESGRPGWVPLCTGK